MCDLPSHELTDDQQPLNPTTFVDRLVEATTEEREIDPDPFRSEIVQASHRVTFRAAEPDGKQVVEWSCGSQLVALVADNAMVGVLREYPLPRFRIRVTAKPSRSR